MAGWAAAGTGQKFVVVVVAVAEAVVVAATVVVVVATVAVVGAWEVLVGWLAYWRRGRLTHFSAGPSP